MEKEFSGEQCQNDGDIIFQNNYSIPHRFPSNIAINIFLINISKLYLMLPMFLILIYLNLSIILM